MDRVKSITIITPNFYPEDTAIGLYTTQFSEFLEKKGFKINIITGFPCYPQWKIYDDYQHKPNFYKEVYNNITIYRYKQYVPKNVTFIKRTFMMLSFFVGNLFNIRKIRNTDLVFCIIPFTISSILMYLLSKTTKAKTWIHIQDFEFDLAIESGILSKKNIFIKLLNKGLRTFEEKILKNADVLSSISSSMMAKTSSKSKKEEVFYFPNWVSSSAIDPKNSNQHKYINSSKFTVLYSGNIGEKQDWDFFLTFCELVKKEKDFEIIIVGNGAYKAKLINLCLNYTFVKFHEVVPYNELNNLLCSADVHFLFQKQKVIDSVMPSKILAMMASTKPSIITGNKKSEVLKILQESKGGFYIDTENAKDVYNAIQFIKSNPDDAIQMGKNARAYILNNFSEEIVLNNFHNKILSI